MIRTISKIHFNNLHIFRGVLQNWIKANILCAEAWKDDDVPWWYNERANLSILAAAAWKKGEIAFEEFTVEKRRRRRKKFQNKLYLGRQDIYMKIGKQEFIAEAKICWSGATSKISNPIPKINASIKWACDDIRKSVPYGQGRLGIVFTVPLIKKSGHKFVDQCIRSWIRKIKEVDCDCYALVFPEVSRKAKHENIIYPGIAVFIQEI